MSFMAGIIFDTSVYVSAIREGNASLLAARRTTPHREHTESPLWLSAVVLEELYAGASQEKAKRLCNRLEREFDLLGRILVPQRSDWTACGQVLSLIGSKHGYERIGRSRLTNDALIAVSHGILCTEHRQRLYWDAFKIAGFGLSCPPCQCILSV